MICTYISLSISRLAPSSQQQGRSRQAAIVFAGEPSAAGSEDGDPHHAARVREGHHLEQTPGLRGAGCPPRSALGRLRRPRDSVRGVLGGCGGWRRGRGCIYAREVSQWASESRHWPCDSCMLLCCENTGSRLQLWLVIDFNYSPGVTLLLVYIIVQYL